jgi:DMSO reductase anchor subunit
MNQLDPMVIGVLIAAAVVAVLAFRGGARTAHRVTQQSREVTRMGGNLTRALTSGAVIVAVQWGVVASTSDPRALGVVFGLPALFAGSAIARMFAVTEIVHGGHRKEARR